jgi:ADP-heptose:LPS heptosyltransferase
MFRRRLWAPGRPPAHANLNRKRILILKPSSLGDVVHTLPLVHALKRGAPDCVIGWVVQDAFVGILKDDPAIDALHTINIPSTSDPHAPAGVAREALRATFSSVRALRAAFRAAPYDIVLDLHASFRSGILGLANPGGIRLGFDEAKELNTLFQNILVSPGPGVTHAVDRNAAFAPALGQRVAPEDFRLVYGAYERQAALRFLAAKSVTPDERLIYANPAARWVTKLWTVERWAKLADSLIGELGAQVIFAGASGDVPYLRAVTELMKRRAFICAGKLSLGASAALADLCAAYVGVDSGPMHIAAMLGKPVVALFGPTDPAKVGPYGKGHVVIRREDLDCLGCRKRSCARRVCLEDLSHLTVFEKAASLITSRRL